VHAELDLIITTDSQKYIDMVNSMYPKGVQNQGRMLYCPFQRDKKLARDDTPTNRVVLDVLKWIDENRPDEYDAFVLLEPTAPLRFTRI